MRTGSGEFRFVVKDERHGRSHDGKRPTANAEEQDERLCKHGNRVLREPWATMIAPAAAQASAIAEPRPRVDSVINIAFPARLNSSDILNLSSVVPQVPESLLMRKWIEPFEAGWRKCFSGRGPARCDACGTSKQPLLVYFGEQLGITQIEQQLAPTAA